MKKSFMTRALATGLSLAMAFSLSAATNVTVASAASTPTMASKQFAVRVGGATKTYKASAATLKKFRITKATVGNSSKATVAVASSKKGIKVTPGTVTGSTVVKVTFKNSKTKKSTAKKFRCVVKPELKKELTMTAEAAGLKKITVTFNQAVEDTSKAVITVKKGTVDQTITATTFAADAASAEIALGSRITAGTYTVSVAGLTDAPLTADVTAKDETLTSFELVGNNLVASADGTTDAAISFKALNQYGEMMAPNNITVSSTFSTAANTVVVDPTATKAGTITCKDIIPTLAIPGTTGTVVIVDTVTGVNLNAQVTYQSKAVPSTAEVLGIYSEKTEKLIEGNLKKGDTVADYGLMINIKDQYGTEMGYEAASKAGVSLNPAPIITDLTTATTLNDSNSKDITVDGANNIVISFTTNPVNNKIQKAGTLNLTIVGNAKGVLATPSIVVDEPTIISSITVAPKTAIYAGQKNDLVVEATDVNGNAVTSYDALDAAQIKMTPTIGGEGTIRLNKNSDGSGKFVYDLTGYTVPHKDNKYKASEFGTITVYANETTSSNYIVKSVSVTVYEKAIPWEVTGSTKDTSTAAASSGAALDIDLSTLTYADQYGNAVEYKNVSTACISYYVEDKADTFTAADGNTHINQAATASALTDKKTIKLVAAANKGNANLYVKYINPDSKVSAVDNNTYDLRIPISVVDGQGVDVSNVEITSINDGNEVYGENDVTFVPAIKATVSTGASISVVVKATINGKTAVLQTSQYKILDATVKGLGEYNAQTNDKSETRTLTVVIDSENGPVQATKEYTFSNRPAAVKVIKTSDATKVTGAAVTGGAVSGSLILGKADLLKTVKLICQYGTEVQSFMDGVVIYTVNATGVNASDVTVAHNGTQEPEITIKNAATEHTATIVYSVGTGASALRFEQEVKFSLS